MATYNGFLIPTSATVFGARSLPPKNGVLLDPSGTSETTYQYRVLSTGVEGSTTDPGSIPAGSVVIGIVY